MQGAFLSARLRERVSPPTTEVGARQKRPRYSQPITWGSHRGKKKKAEPEQEKELKEPSLPPPVETKEEEEEEEEEQEEQEEPPTTQQVPFPTIATFDVEQGTAVYFQQPRPLTADEERWKRFAEIVAGNAHVSVNDLFHLPLSTSDTVLEDNPLVGAKGDPPAASGANILRASRNADRYQQWYQLATFDNTASPVMKAAVRNAEDALNFCANDEIRGMTLAQLIQNPLTGSRFAQLIGVYVDEARMMHDAAKENLSARLEHNESKRANLLAFFNNFQKWKMRQQRPSYY